MTDEDTKQIRTIAICALIAFSVAVSGITSCGIVDSFKVNEMRGAAAV